MAKKYRDLRAKMSPEARRRAEARTRELLAEMPLHQLRQALHLSQEEIAQAMEVGQANVSKLERRTDMYLSTLRRFIEAMGGELEINACFPEGCVRINQLADLGPDGTPTEAHA